MALRGGASWGGACKGVVTWWGGACRGGVCHVGAGHVGAGTGWGGACGGGACKGVGEVPGGWGLGQGVSHRGEACRGGAVALRERKRL